MKAIHGPTFFPTSTLGGCNFSNSSQHIVAFDQLSEGSVLAIEETRVPQANEKLAAGGIRVLRSRHRNYAPHVRAIIEFRLDLVSRIARSPEMLGGNVFCVRIPTLNHETFDDAVKCRAIIKALAGELLEILDCLWGNVRPEGDDHFAFGGFDNGNFGVRTHAVRFRRADQGTTVTDLM